MLTALSLALCLAQAPDAAAQGSYRRAAYLMVWNGGSFGGATGASIVESIMVDLYLGSMRRSYHRVHYCKGSQCTRDQVLKDLGQLQQQYEAVDFFLATHGLKDPEPLFSVEPNATITATDLLKLRDTWHRRHRLRAVMGMNCDGATLLPTWIKLGFDVGMGSKQLNGVGWANVPLFMKLFRQRDCLFGGDCSRTFGQAMDLAWRLTSWMEPISLAMSKAGGQLDGYPDSRVDSTPIYAGDRSIRVTTYKGVYNACNGEGDAHGFITPKDRCCLPGQTCDGYTYSCNGFRFAATDSIDSKLCTGGYSPTTQCTTGADCSGAGLCLVDEAGMRCARGCTADTDCYSSERCLVTIDADGRQAGRYCAATLSTAQRACVCKNMLASGCGQQSQPGAQTCSTETTLGSVGQPGAGTRDKTLRFAVQAQTQWLSACGCPVSTDSAAQMCCAPALPGDQTQAGCNGASVSGVPGPRAWIPLLALLALAWVHRRR